MPATSRPAPPRLVTFRTCQPEHSRVQQARTRPAGPAVAQKKENRGKRTAAAEAAARVEPGTPTLTQLDRTARCHPLSGVVWPAEYTRRWEVAGVALPPPLRRCCCHQALAGPLAAPLDTRGPWTTCFHLATLLPKLWKPGLVWARGRPCAPPKRAFLRRRCWRCCWHERELALWRCQTGRRGRAALADGIVWLELARLSLEVRLIFALIGRCCVAVLPRGRTGGLPACLPLRAKS